MVVVATFNRRMARIQVCGEGGGPPRRITAITQTCGWRMMRQRNSPGWPPMSAFANTSQDSVYGGDGFSLTMRGDESFMPASVAAAIALVSASSCDVA